MWWEISGHLETKNNELYIGGMSTLDLAKEFGTPLYVYNVNRILDNYRRFRDIISKYTDKEVRVHYAMKANSNPGILRYLNAEGSWIDAVSPEEAELAINAGFPASKIMFTGTSVSNKDMRRILDHPGIMMNIDSSSQLKRLKELLSEYSITSMDISFRIDPGVTGAGGHWRTITAGKESHGIPIKFGIPEDEVLETYKKAVEDGFNPVGIHMHIGSQWLSDEEVKEYLFAVDSLLGKAQDVVKLLGCNLEFVDFGGGPGIPYKEEQNEFPLDWYAKETCKRVAESGLNFKALLFEPGRYVVGDSSLLLTEVNTIKKRYGDLIVGVNSGFNHLIRPVLYGAYHEIINCNKVDELSNTEVTVVGNLCQTGDVLATKRKMPMLEEGDILAFHNAGAYGYTMASRYNLRELPKEILIREGKIIN
ncbi:MAG: diaminopimelate decarboxylase [Candidatus Aenigmarchaeota archaeon]|nr:diaminopimelate decarboxylase [Candidatus Aenigmarchaeota archaeon]